MVYLLLLAVGIIGANSLVLSPIAGDVAAGLGHGTASDVMTAAACYGMGVAGSALLLAPRADRVGSAMALKTALWSMIAGLAVSATAPGIVMLSVAQTVTGIGAGMALPAIYGLAAQIAKPGKEARTIGTVLTGWTLSMVGGVTLSTHLAELAGWRAVFVALGTALVIVQLLLARAPLPPAPAQATSSTPLSALRVPGITAALFSVAMLGTGFYGIYNYLGAHLTENLLRPTSDGGWLTLSYGIGFGAAMLVDPWLDRVGPRRGLLAVFSALALFYPVMSLTAPSYDTLLPLMALWGVLQHLGLNLTVGRLGALDASQRGAIMGLNSTVMYLSVFGATVFYRPVFEGWGLGACMVLSGGMAVLGAGEALVARLKAARLA